jgi:hypothetical protein
VLALETTALAVLAWLRDPAHAASVERALRWIAGRWENGHFGSTQATVLALEAILAHDAASAAARPARTVTVLVDGEPMGTVEIPEGARETVLGPPLPVLASGGRHVIALEMAGGEAPLPYAIDVRLHARTPPAVADAPLTLNTQVLGEGAREGEPIDVRVVVRNAGTASVGMPVAIVGLPGGVEVRADRLAELVKEGAIASYETRGREVILYWLGFEPGEERVVTLSCIAAVPGVYRAPASRAYPYYAPHAKTWEAGVTLSIAPR